MPASRNRKLKVPKTNRSGKPAEKPKDNMRKLAGCKYTRKEASQEAGRAASALFRGWGVEADGSVMRVIIQGQRLQAHAQRCITLRLLLAHYVFSL
jgi:hypothetical protein